MMPLTALNWRLWVYGTISACRASLLLFCQCGAGAAASSCMKRFLPSKKYSRSFLNYRYG